MRYTLDGIEYDDEASPPISRFERFTIAMAESFTLILENFVDLIASIPPFSWLDAALRGSVGPRS